MVRDIVNPLLNLTNYILNSINYIKDYVDGSFYKDAGLNAITNPQTRSEMYHNLIDMLARIHAVDVDKSGLAQYGKRVVPGSSAADTGFVARQVKV